NRVDLRWLPMTARRAASARAWDCQNRSGVSQSCMLTPKPHRLTIEVFGTHWYEFVAEQAFAPPNRIPTTNGGLPMWARSDNYLDRDVICHRPKLEPLPP